MLIIENEKHDGKIGLLFEDVSMDDITVESEIVKESIETQLSESEFNVLKNNKNLNINESNKTLITESQDRLYHIKGLYSEADVQLRNPRIYRKKILDREKQAFERNQIARRKGWGEAEHPTDRSHVIFDRMSHRTISLDWDGNKLIGDSILIEGHPYGDMAIAIHKNGGGLSVSSRAVGSVIRKYVQENLRLICWDLVPFPSANSALEVIREQEDLLMKNGISEMTIDNAKRKLNSSDLRSKDYGKLVVELFSEMIKISSYNITESEIEKFEAYKRINHSWLNEKFVKSSENDFEKFCYQSYKNIY